MGSWFKNPEYLKFHADLETLKQKYFPTHPDDPPTVFHREDMLNARKALPLRHYQFRRRLRKLRLTFQVNESECPGLKAGTAKRGSPTCVASFSRWNATRIRLEQIRGQFSAPIQARNHELAPKAESNPVSKDQLPAHATPR